LYLGVEYPPQLWVVNLRSHLVIQQIELIGMRVNPADGMEAFTFVPVSSTFSWLLAASQVNGHVYTFPFNLTHPSYRLSPVSSFIPKVGWLDISSLKYRPHDDTLWALFDSQDALVQWDLSSKLSLSEPPTWRLKREFNAVPGKGQEGLEFVNKSKSSYVFIGQDRTDSMGKQIQRFDWPAEY